MDEDLNREALESKVHPEGRGEDPAVEAYLGPEFEKAPVQDKVSILLELQKITLGQNAILARIEAGDTFLQDQLNVIRVRLDEREKAAEAYEANQQKFIEELFDDMNKLRSTDPEVIAKAQAQAVKDVQGQVTNKKARRTVEGMQMKERLLAEPQETITPTGELVLIREGGHPRPKLLPEKIVIGSFHWILEPGIPIKVPQSVAQQYRQRKEVLKENEGIADLLGAGPDKKTKKDTEIAREWSKYSDEPFKIGSRV